MATSMHPTPVAAPAGRPERRRSSPVTTVVAVVGVLMLLAALQSYDSLRVSGVSMRPTLTEGDRLLLDTWSARSADWQRGDLVAFEHDVAGRSELLVKRVVAVGGDRVGLEDGVLVVNRQRVVEPYADPDAVDSVYFGPVVVPAGSVFVLGDNRLESYDSRDFGPVSSDQIDGRVVARLWPLGR